MVKSIRTRLTIAFVGIAVVPILVTCVFLYTRSSDALTKMAQQQQQLEAERVAIAVRDHIHELELVLQLTGRAHAFLSLALDQQKAILQELLAYENRFEELVLINREGQETIRYNRIQVVLPGALKNRSSDPFFLQSLQQKETCFSQVFFDPNTGEPLMKIAIPLRSFRSGRVEAVLLGTARLKKLWDLLASISKSDQSVFIVNHEGQVVGHRDPSIVLRGVRYTLPKPDQGTVLGLDGNPVIMAIKQVEIGTHNLYIVAQLPAASALHFSQSIQGITIFAAGLALCFAIALAVLVIRTIIFPLRHLAATARDIQKGEFSKQVHVNSNDEIGELAHAFNAMTLRLRLTIEELKVEVEERKREIVERQRAEEEKTELEERLRQSHKMEAVGTLAGGIAHDFNNILGIIMGGCEMVQRRLPAESENQRRLKNIIEAVERASSLVQQILTFSRQSKQACLPLNLAAVVTESLTLIRSTLPTTITIKDTIEDCGLVLADKTQVHQIIMNLCTNAYHAMQEKGGVLSIDLSLQTIPPSPTGAIFPAPPSGTYLYLKVSDTGMGIDSQTLSRVYDPYFTTKTQGSGTGMGLSIVHGIIKSYSGGIGIESRTGLGTTVHILLPRLLTPLIDSEQVQEEAPLVSGGEHILVVDDEALLTEVMAERLEIQGYTVTTFNDSLASWQAFREAPEQFDLIITDMTMPHMTGSGLIAKVLALRPEQPIILCSGYSDQMDQSTALSIGARAYLNKPVTGKHLFQTILQVLNQGPRQP